MTRIGVSPRLLHPQPGARGVFTKMLRSLMGFCGGGCAGCCDAVRSQHNNITQASNIRFFLMASHPRLIGRGPVNRRHLRAGHSQVNRELSAMVNLMLKQMREQARELNERKIATPTGANLVASDRRPRSTTTAGLTPRTIIDPARSYRGAVWPGGGR